MLFLCLHLCFLLQFRQTGQGQEQRGDGAEGAGAERAQPVDIPQDDGPGADVGQGGLGEGTDGADCGGFQPFFIEHVHSSSLFHYDLGNRKTDHVVILWI